MSESVEVQAPSTSVSTYMGKPYYPWWLDNLADDVTGEGPFMEGIAVGAETVHSIVTAAREIYEGQEFSFAGNYGDDGFLELYTTRVHGKPTSVVVTITRNAAGQADHVVVNHRPRSSVLLFSRLMSETFAGTPIAKLFITAVPEEDGSTTIQNIRPNAGFQGGTR